MKPSNFDYYDMIVHLFPEKCARNDNDVSLDRNMKTITFQVTEDCSLRCTYCYQPCKKPNYMTFDVAKKFIDYLFDNRLNENAAINEFNTMGIIIDFIGGEPFLNIKLVKQICDYFEEKFLQNPDCEWGVFHRYSFSSNGVAYFDDEVQDFIKEYGWFSSVSITVDGCKELHDKCRLFPDGSPSYDLAIKAALSELELHQNDATKITQSPDNISYTFQGVKNMFELGFSNINMNPVFEEGWTIEHAKIVYEEFKKIADWIVDNNLQDKIYFRLFDSEDYHNSYHNNEELANNNWCGSTSAMYAIDYKGKIYPCIRFMESSLNGEAEPYAIGDIETGIGNTELYKNRLDELHNLKKDMQSEQKCLDCPIESGCAWCTGYNYQHFGTICHRATYICEQQKAAALGSLYFYKACKDKNNYDKIKITKELALEIISEEEWEKLQWNYQGE